MLPREYHARRRVCRAIFLAAGLAPTLAVIALVGWRTSALYRDIWAGQLERRLGLPVAIARLDAPRPRVTVCRGLQLSDPETLGPLATIARLELGDQGTYLLALVEGLQIDGAAWPTLRRALEAALRRPAMGLAPLRIVAREVSLAASEPWPTAGLDELIVWLERSAGGPVLVADFRVGGVAMSAPARLRLARQLQGAQRATHCELRTQGATLPVALAGRLFPEVGRLGARATFNGRLTAITTDTASLVEIHGGQLNDVDLERLGAQPYGHTWRGAADVQLEQLTVFDGRVTEAIGQIEGGPGLIGRALVWAATNELRLLPGQTLSQAIDGDHIRYGELAARFKLNGAGLELTGQCRLTTPGTVLAANQVALLTTPAHAHASSALARTLLAGREPWASPALERIGRWLPVSRPPVEMARRSGEPRQ